MSLMNKQPESIDESDLQALVDNQVPQGKHIEYRVSLPGNSDEHYLTDKPYPSCLIYGQTFSGDPVHSVWAYNEQKQWAVLITVYRPDPNLWTNWRERRRQQ